MVRALTPTPAYARVDLVDTAAGPVVMEVELAEPYLGCALLPPALRAAALTRFVNVLTAAF